MGSLEPKNGLKGYTVLYSTYRQFEKGDNDDDNNV